MFETEELPCYAVRFTTNNAQTIRDKRAAIAKAIKGWGAEGKKDTGVCVFSVTEKDKGYKDWLTVLKEHPGTCIIPTISKYHENYTCWLVCVPCVYKEDEHSGQWK